MVDYLLLKSTAGDKIGGEVESLDATLPFCISSLSRSGSSYNISLSSAPDNDATEQTQLKWKVFEEYLDSKVYLSLVVVIGIFTCNCGHFQRFVCNFPKKKKSTFKSGINCYFIRCSY